MSEPNHVVITSIFAPTKAVLAFAGNPANRLIVVGDKKTPSDWSCPGAIFLAAGEKTGFRLEKKLPYNHYSRKMLGYLYAMRAGATRIYETDDDNLPKADWHIPDFGAAYEQSAEHLGFVNVYSQYTQQKIWPRGFPLDLIKDAAPLALQGKAAHPVGIFQGLADGDPDVDAIYRLTCNAPCLFEEKPPVVLAPGTWCPYNSQNTTHIKAVFPLLYLPSSVTFRFTDILRGLLAQPILHHYGYRLGFCTASVFQERTEHDYVKDFESEIPCYLHSKNVIAIASGALRQGLSLSENLYRVYEALSANALVQGEELNSLAAWLEDVEENT